MPFEIMRAFNGRLNGHPKHLRDRVKKKNNRVNS